MRYKFPQNIEIHTIGPIQIDIAPLPVELLGGVVGIFGCKPHHVALLQRDGKPSMEEEADLVPEGEGLARVNGGSVE